MNYKKLIYYRLRDERALIFLFSIMLVSILIGTIIKNIIDLKGVIVILFVFIVFIGRYFYKKHSFNKIYQELPNEEKAKLDDDLNKTYFFSGRDYALSSKYIIDFKHSKIIKYSSVLIIDKSHELSPHHNKQIVMCDMVYIFTQDGKMGLISKEYRTVISNEQFYDGLYNYIKAQNPNVLEGYTRENRQKIKEKYDIKI